MVCKLFHYKSITNIHYVFPDALKYLNFRDFISNFVVVTY